MANHRPATEALLKHEGGYVNDPLDPGGETNFGLTKGTFPELDLKNLTREEAIAVYKTEYWDGLRLGEVEDQRVADFIYLWAVNSGNPPGRGGTRPVKHVQEVCNWFLKSDIAVDGQMGSMTVAAINKCAKMRDHRFLKGLLALVLAFRVARVRKRPDQTRFLAGWFNRDFDSAGFRLSKEDRHDDSD